MTKHELVDKLEEIIDLQNKGHRDLEFHHMDADQLLLDYINDPEVSEAFYDIEKWYA